MLRPQDLAFADDAYLGHASWIRPAFDRLGEVRGLSVLDLGCGHGMASVVLARRGAQVTACDLSLGYLKEAQARARANGVTANRRSPTANTCRSRTGRSTASGAARSCITFDLRCAGPELHRALRPGGVAVFCEPWGENRWLRWARRHAPYPGKERTPDEDPLGCRHLAALRPLFRSVEVTGHQLLSMASRVLGGGRLSATLRRCDTMLLRRWPHLQRYCRYVVLSLRK